MIKKEIGTASAKKDALCLEDIALSLCSFASVRVWVKNNATSKRLIGHKTPCSRHIRFLLLKLPSNQLESFVFLSL